MTENDTKAELRNTKTQGALDRAMLTLLTRQSFSKVTVRDICVEAAVSRASFYARFIDKYDFLEYWLLGLIPEGILLQNNLEEAEIMMEAFISENKKVMKNILSGANEETLGVLFNVVHETLKLQVEKTEDGKPTANYIVYSRVFAGGILSYVIWLIKNNFPSYIKPMNSCLFNLTAKLKELSFENE